MPLLVIWLSDTLFLVFDDGEEGVDIQSSGSTGCNLFVLALEFSFALNHQSKGVKANPGLCFQEGDSTRLRLKVRHNPKVKLVSIKFSHTLMVAKANKKIKHFVSKS